LKFPINLGGELISDEENDEMVVFVIVLIISTFMLAFAVFQVNRNSHALEEESDLERERETVAGKTTI
jgi:hypothetical protein